MKEGIGGGDKKVLIILLGTYLECNLQNVKLLKPFS